MTDYEQIVTLIHRYSRLSDDGDLVSRADLYAPDGEYTGPDGTTVVGREAIRARPGPPRDPDVIGRHITSNPVVIIDGDSASAVTDFLHVRKTTDGLHPNTIGRYEDQFVKIGGAWYLQSRRAAPVR